ncbi:hypothetical protein Dsin_021661 [Dipteronia sinensis]|uniref:Arf-GAP domain-containing protein n=1 Tax=Dipteronia sinensis TaxID=43782 RepID=A0AAE0A1J7_9ROSI|nr:hypothetical protein Dsin_021661 [Dipteronia sinensis]
MGSRKEEERNEKIIRGLMKLPPNRRCINCNSLGPQYVCTNFWTFVCMTCSGIHREFTHRVKSVSMAKFTSQEVEALQNGGNQRAREIYLKDWDLQRQRLPDSSNAEKVRQFIKNVYVDRKYAGGKDSEKPPKDMQSLRSHEDVTRRASSYHSYSQSPPYDYQYEAQRYGKQAAVLTRKPGSDRGHYVGKISSFVYSPGRMSEQMFEDRFANEGSGSRISDYSVSSGGDPFRSGTESPNFNSPPIQTSRDVLSSNASLKKDLDGIPRPQRTTSSGSIASLESKSMSLKSCNSGGFVDANSDPERATGTHHNKVSSFTQSSNTVNYGGLDLFEAQVVPEPVPSSAPSIDLFQLPAASSAPPVNTLHTSLASSALPVNLPPQTSRDSSFDLFEIAEQPSTVTLDTKSLEVSNTGNEGWATFDTSLPAASIPGTENINPAAMPNIGSSSVKFDQYSSFNTSMKWSAFHDSGDHRPSPSSDLGYDGLHNVQAPAIVTNTPSWNAFGDSTSHLPLEGVKQSSEPQLAAYKASSPADQYLSSIVPEDSNLGGNRIAASHHGPPEGPGSSHVDIGSSYSPSVLPLVEETPAAATDYKSTNPFDFPYDSDFEQSNMFLDMCSLQTALPNEQLPSTFIGTVNQSWFPQNPVTPYIPAAAQGGLAYMSGQSPSSQLSNVSAQGPVASIGGNPFA